MKLTIASDVYDSLVLFVLNHFRCKSSNLSQSMLYLAFYAGYRDINVHESQTFAVKLKQQKISLKTLKHSLNDIIEKRVVIPCQEIGSLELWIS